MESLCFHPEDEEEGGQGGASSAAYHFNHGATVQESPDFAGSSVSVEAQLSKRKHREEEYNEGEVNNDDGIPEQ